MKAYKISLIAVLIIFSASLKAQNLSNINPEDIRISSDRLGIIDKVLQEYIDKKEVPGAVALIARKGKIGYLKSFGMKDIEENKQMTDDAIFRIASMTKAITTVGVMILYEDGRFKLDDPISNYIPEFKNMKTMNGDNAEQEITIRHLLTHTSGLSYAMMGPQETYDLYIQNNIYGGFGKTQGTIGETVKRLASLPIMHQPGEKIHYGMNADVLGYLIEVISDMTLQDFFLENIFEPLEMTDTHFFLPKSKEGRLAVLYGTDSTNQLNKIVGEAKNGFLNYSDYSTYAYNSNYFSGGGGLLSTASDYYKFLQMLIDNGKFNNKQILSRKTVELMTSNQTGDMFIYRKGEVYGFGFAISKGPSETGTIESTGTYRWLGLFNTHFWVDPKEELIGILLTQIQPNVSDIDRKFKTLVYQSIID
jgi:CubicO group peptidase (beta-lactamase class C family)